MRKKVLIVIVLWLTFLGFTRICYGISLVESKDAYEEPVIDGLIGEREYYDAYQNKITFHSGSGSITGVDCYIKNNNDYIYIAFRIPDPQLNNLLILRFKDSEGNIVAKHNRYDQGPWEMYWNEDDWVNRNSVSVESEWGSYSGYRIVEWKIPLNSGQEHDLQVVAGEPVRFGVRYGLDVSYSYPETYSMVDPESWAWLYTKIPSRVKNGDFEDPVMTNPWQIPGWGDGGWMGHTVGKDGMGMGILEGGVHQDVEIDENSSLYFWYKPEPRGGSVPLQVIVGDKIILDKVFSGNNEEYQWKEVELRLGDIIKTHGLTGGINELRFNVPSGARYGDSSTQPRIIIDSVRIDASTPLVTITESYVSSIRADVGSEQEVGFRLLRMPSNEPLVGVDVTVNGTMYRTNSDGWIRFLVTSSFVERSHWVVQDVTGYPDFQVAASIPEIIWDKVIVTTFNQRINLGSSINWSAKYEYNNEVFDGTLVLSQPNFQTTDEPYTYTHSVMGIIDSKYGITEFTAKNFTIIYDEVILELSIEKPRIDVTSTPKLNIRGYYSFDETEYMGTVKISQPINKVGKQTFSVEEIADSRYGLTRFKGNSVEVVFDKIKIASGGTEKNTLQVGETATIWIKAEYEYDKTIFDASKGTIFLNDEPMSWSSTNNRWEYSATSQKEGVESYRITDLKDNTFGLTSISNEIMDITVEWKPAGIPGFYLSSIIVGFIISMIIVRCSITKWVEPFSKE